MGWALESRDARLFFSTPVGKVCRLQSCVAKFWVGKPTWVSALADLGISLFLKDQNKYKLLRYGEEYVEKRKEPLRRDHVLSHIAL